MPEPAPLRHGRGRRPRHRPPWWPEDRPWPERERRGLGRRFRRRFLGILFGFLVLVVSASALVGALVAALLGGRSTAAAVAAALAVLLLVLAVAGVALARAARGLAGPIGDLMEAADQVADGDFTARVDARGSRDIRRLGRAFNTMTEQLATSEERRCRLMADIAHEVRTPLTVIQGQAEGMLDGLYPADPDRLQSIVDETRLLARLLEDLQTLSGAESGTLRLRREIFDAGLLAREVATAIAPHAAVAGVDLHAPDGGPCQVDADPDRIRQMIENLVTNAIRHTPAGGTVRINARAGGGVATLEVADTGSGIPSEDLPHVFDRYRTAADSGGTGLGLAIARSIVEAHGGTISAESEVGSGTMVRAVLPAAPS